ncbi:MAG: hypothetical protein JNM31_03410 [Flavobacteriales bacterium]|nr:hypothetical protein [Flavobacteriales bacterium]
MNDSLDSLGFYDEYPLYMFETSLGFNSYRKLIWDLENAWLASGMTGLDPDDVDVVGDAVLAAMLNSQGAVMIGGVIHYVDPLGTWWKILNGDCSLLALLISSPDAAALDSNVWTYKWTPTGECSFGFVDKNHQTWDNNKKKLKWKHWHAYSSIDGEWVYTGLQKTYRRILGIWFRLQVSHNTKVYGIATYHNCYDTLHYSEVKVRPGSSCRSEARHSIDYDRYKSCDPRAEFRADGALVATNIQCL